MGNIFMKGKLNRTILIVFFFHLLSLFFLYLMEGKACKKEAQKNIAVNTIIIKEPLTKVAATFKKTVPNNSKVATKKIEAKAKSIYKEPTKKEVISSDLINKLQNELSILEKEPTFVTKTKKLKLPVLSSLEINQLKQTDNQIDMVDFQGKLIDFFKSHLKLPEYGEVKVKMKIKEDGMIDDIEVLSSKSGKNEVYLKNILLKISLPWLNDYLPKQEEVDLIICFTNDI